VAESVFAMYNGASPKPSINRYRAGAQTKHSDLTTLAYGPYDEISRYIKLGADFARPAFAQKWQIVRFFVRDISIMIKVEGLTKRYARTVAVDNISFEVERGQIVGFLGPNGAGKTTTMRILTCFLPPTEGKASVAGFDVQEHPMEVKRRIGYLPETPPLYPEMEVSEYLDYTGRLKGIASADIKKRVDEVVGRCALGEVRDKLIAKLSKGYRQRVGIAQAIIHNPPVLILDEPTSGLDPKQIIEIRDLLHELAGEHTIILSTHILSEVEHSCERVIIISGGKVVATDSVANLTNRMRGSESVAVEIEAAGDLPGAAEAQQRLEQVQGVSRVVAKEPRDGRLRFEIESLQGRHIRADLARTVVNAGWNLSELSAVGLSLEEIFLQLTASEKKTEKTTDPEKAAEPAPEGEQK
jgi:ABC-2 type transport system ATP-binding protein